MILFHGTIEDNIKNIKKSGLLNTTKDQWITEVTKTNICCVSNEPTSGEGGSPIHFAGRHERCVNQNGYLVISSLPQDIYQEKVVAIFDNKVLDDYVRFHFFLRHEFREIGFLLYQELESYYRAAKEFPSPLVCLDKKNTTSRDQKVYYKDLGQKQTIMYKMGNVAISNHMLGLISFLGSWDHFYNFLAFHFEHVNQERYQKFTNEAPYNNDAYWKKFYAYFPAKTFHKQWEKWFSPEWLEKRKLDTPTKNSQILTKSIEPEYISGFIHVTNSSGVVSHFRPIKRQHKTRARMTLRKRIWRKVYRMLKS